ncbi:MAG: esterase [Elusimicrobiota bacterium]
MTNPEAARRAKYGPLDAIEVPGEPDAPVVVCLHGYGANAADLAPLAMELRLGAPARWIFPDAPLELEFGGFMNSRAWFPIDMEELDRLQREGRHRDFARVRPPKLDAARQAVRELIDAAGISWDQLIIGGFSQGSMVALDVLLHETRKPKGLFILSGNLVDEKNVQDRARRLAGLRYFQSHGTDDVLLSFQGAAALSGVLREAGLEGALRRFAGGHALPPEVLMDLGAYLKSLQDAAAPQG